MTAEEPLGGDQTLQHAVLEELSVAGNYRAWIAGLISPWLRDDPLEIGSGLGDLAAELTGLGHRVTASEAEPDRLAVLRRRFDGHPTVDVRRLAAPVRDRGEHSEVFAVNVLEHIEDDVAAIRSFRDLTGQDGRVIVFVPAFPSLLGRFDREIGHVRRYRRRTLRSAIEAAGLDVADIRYVNSAGLLSWFVVVRALGRRPQRGPLLTIFDRLVVPVLRRLEARVRPPFGQSLFAVGIKHDEGGT